MIKIKEVSRYRIRIAIVGIVAGLAIGWFSPFWTGYAIKSEGIDGRIQQCLMNDRS